MLTHKLALTALLGALAVSGTALAADKSSAAEAIAAAKAAQKAAAEAGGEWRDTGKMIKKAEEAAASGNFATAVDLAKQAEDQGNLGRDQALGEVGVGNPSYLYN